VYPFSLNSTIGCLFNCSYCYLQSFPFSLHTDFGKEIKIKAWLPEKLDTELEKKKDLPQHLKRVQINPATEGYHPLAISYLKSQEDRFLMREILQVFQKHWDQGNKWMIHLVTKSHLILKDIDLIQTMREQVQIELTITTLDEDKARILEGYAPLVRKRLEVIEEYAKAGVFVRAMCMPFIGDHAAAVAIRETLFNAGASGFKHKAMNYWDVDSLLEGETVRAQGKRDIILNDLLVKSGEHVSKKGANQIELQMPGKTWKEMASRKMEFVDYGYRDLNSIDWGYAI
jgi:DNA repair photolyase